MGRKAKKRFSPEQKLKIVKEGQHPGVKIADLCKHYGIYPADYYRWKKLAESAMIDGLKPNTKKKNKISRQEERLLQENEYLRQVIIQLTKEHVELKKKVYE